MAITKDQAAVEAAKAILNQGDWFEPMTVGAEIEALKKILAQSPRPDLTAQITVAGQIISVQQLLAGLSQFNRALKNPLDSRLFADLTTLKPEHLTVLEKGLAAFIAPPETKASMDAVVPTKAKLQELQDILKAQAETTASIKDRLGRPSQLQQQIEQAQEIGIRAKLLRVAVSKNLFTTLNESSYIRDLQTIYGKEAVNQLLAKRVDLAVNQSITALALNQLGVSDPPQAAIYFTSQLEKNLRADRGLLAVALAKTNKSDRKNALTDAKNLAGETAKEIDPAAKAYKTEQNSSPIYRANAKNIAQGEIEAALIKSGRSLTKKQAARLAETLAKYSDQPEKQLRILKKILPGATSEVGQKLITDLKPAISALAKSSDHPTMVETTTADSLTLLARTNPELFPFRFVGAVRTGKLSGEKAAALMVRISQESGTPIDYVAMRLSGVTAKNLEAHLNNLTKGQPALGFLPTQPPLSPTNSVFRRLNDALPELNRLDASQEEFQFNQVASGLNLQSNWHSITNFFNVRKAVQLNIGRLPPVNRMVSSVQTVFSGLRVQSGAVNSVFNFFSSVSGGFGKLGSAASYPFRAVGSVVSTGWNNVKTWAGTQVKAGLAKAGAWLMKTVGPEMAGAAAQLGLMAVGEGAAVFLAQAVPVAGQIAAVGLIGGNILKFIWDHKKEIGLGLGGMFFLGQMLLAKVLGFLGSAAWTLGGALAGGIGGFLVGGPIGAAIGAGLGGTLGFAIGSGALGTALSGLGTALGSAAAGLSSFIGSLTAPSLVAGLGTTIATVTIGGIIGAGILDILFIKPRTNSAMFVPTEKSSSAPRDGSGESGGGGSGGSCEVATSGYCSPSNFSAIFGQQADNASRICNGESIGGRPAIINDGCLGEHGGVYQSRIHTWDYSVGLFQINMLAHPNPAFLRTTAGLSLSNKIAGIGRAGKTCYNAFDATTLNTRRQDWPTSYCNVIDQELLSVCVSWFQDPVNNIAYAGFMSNGGQSWGPWSVARSCGIVQ